MQIKQLLGLTAKRRLKKKRRYLTEVMAAPFILPLQPASPYWTEREGGWRRKDSPWEDFGTRGHGGGRRGEDIAQLFCLPLSEPNRVVVVRSVKPLTIAFLIIIKKIPHTGDKASLD